MLIFSDVIKILASVEVTGDTQLHEQSTTSLLCTVRANPVPTLIWLKRKEGGLTAVLNTTRMRITSLYRSNDETATSTLRIIQVLPSDQGEYVCVAASEQITSSSQIAFDTITINITGTLFCDKSLAFS